MKQATAIAEIAKVLGKADRVTALTGAGVSAASGIPTFRGKDGLWKSHTPEKLATPEAFRSNPKLVWEWYQWRRQVIASCEPNRAHQVLAVWSRRFPRFRLITQNVDGLHERARTEHVTRFHGSIWEVLCWEDCADSPGRWLDRSHSFSQLPPPCPYCDSFIRPGVVWFGEGIPTEVLESSAEAVACDVFLTLGTSSLVQPAASLGHAARSGGAYTVEINLEPTPVSDQLDLSVQGRAEIVLDQIEALLS